MRLQIKQAAQAIIDMRLLYGAAWFIAVSLHAMSIFRHIDDGHQVFSLIFSGAIIVVGVFELSRASNSRSYTCSAKRLSQRSLEVLIMIHLIVTCIHGGLYAVEHVEVRNYWIASALVISLIIFRNDLSGRWAFLRK